ncbi:MAG: twin-arginine translocase subunit TatC [Chloroflexota bacterium]|nr:twin-arginine translocase subunit TatC [Chloroflexota bacterium]
MATSKIDEHDLLAPLYQDQDDDDDGSAMSLIEHLEELRWRIFKSLIAIAVGSIVAFIFREPILYFLQLPLPKQADAIGHGKIIVTGLTEGFTVYLLVSIVAGALLALPVLLYQIWAFVAPGLLVKEKKYAVPFIFVGLLLFAAGISLGYIVLRYPVEWFVTFAADSFTPLITAGSYFSFVALFLLAFGIVFEIPLVLTFMAQVDLISSKTLVKKRAVAHVSMWAAATLLTPGADFYSPLFLGVAMSILFELTIIFIKIIKK